MARSFGLSDILGEFPNLKENLKSSSKCSINYNTCTVPAWYSLIKKKTVTHLLLYICIFEWGDFILVPVFIEILDHPDWERVPLNSNRLQ